MTKEPIRLERSLGFLAILAYGVGDILGAGIYALVGKVAEHAGAYTWLSFIVTLIVAGFTALSYAELGSRMPESGGEALFTYRAFRRPEVGFIVGWLVLFSGIVSCATVSIAVSDYWQATFPGWPDTLRPITILLFLVGITGISIWGMRQSSLVNIVCTLVEVTGLLFVIVVGLRFILGDTGEARAVEASQASTIHWGGVLQGGALAFFAFLGFEDIVNVAEETKSPRTNVPRAILYSVAIAGTIYVVVAWVATSVVPLEQLTESKGPLLSVIEIAAPGFPLGLFSVIALFAVANTGLLNLVMGSRLLYGMASRGLVPGALGRLHPKTRTPHIATLLIIGIVTVMALSGSLKILAGTTNVLLLLVFMMVHASLTILKIRGDEPTLSDLDEGEQAKHFTTPMVVSIVGIVLCATLIVFAPRESLLVAGGVIAVGILVGAIDKLSGRDLK